MEAGTLTNFLGSEVDYIETNGSVIGKFGQDYFEADASSINISGYSLSHDYYQVWNRYKGTIGNPIGETVQFSGNISYQLFETGSIVSSEHGTFPLYGGIRQKYLDISGLYGNIGAPESGEYSWNGEIRQDFSNGYIVWYGSYAQEYFF